MTERVLVTGATGFIGSHLAQALVERGHAVRAMTRRTSRYRGAGSPVYGDVGDAASLAAAMDGVSAAYYLIHSLEHRDFERRDAEAALVFGQIAARAGVGRIIYLGGLGDDAGELSPHLRSRRTVERLLGVGGVPVTALRAGMIVGDGSISWELTRQLVDHLPIMITPRWVFTRTQPIALPDVIRYLVEVLDRPEATGRTFEIGGAEVLRYIDMLKRIARIRHRPLSVLPLPLLTPRLSSLWLALVTTVDLPTARNLVDSVINEVVVRENSIKELLPGEPLGFDDAVRLAIAARTAR